MAKELTQKEYKERLFKSLGLSILIIIGILVSVSYMIRFMIFFFVALGIIMVTRMFYLTSKIDWFNRMEKDI